MQKNVQEIIKQSQFYHTNKLLIVCHASQEGLGAMQKNENRDYKPISCASRYLTYYEVKYSTNELEVLAIVWLIEHFGNYILGVKFEVVFDPKALETAIKSNYGKKTYSSRLTRWIDRSLAFDMEVVQQPSRTKGFADCLSRHASDYNES